MRRSLRALPAQTFGAATLRVVSPAIGGACVLHESLPAGCRLPNLYHVRTDELVYMVEGWMWAVIDGRRMKLKAGDSIFLKRGTRHCFYTTASAAQALSVFSPRLDLRRPDVVVEEAA